MWPQQRQFKLDFAGNGVSTNSRENLSRYEFEVKNSGFESARTSYGKHLEILEEKSDEECEEFAF